MYQPLFINWQDRNNTGIAIIDEQHRGILSIINSLYFLTEKGMSDDALRSLISDAIRSYSRIHFITEERILQATGYPDLEGHKEMHRKLSQETEHMDRVAIMENDSKPLLIFLKKWWVEHINEQDMLYVPHLREHG
ncbi:MAG: bacteriohemerythrin [Betaproteobacteria bacterium]|nr:bacteriohemerythrin [Betaproteobacteria bacterium]